MTYSEKLKDPRWQKKRLEVLERDKWKCCDCDGAEKTLQVHHCFYEKGDPWETDVEFLTTLCEDCHESRQELEADARRALGKILVRTPSGEGEDSLRELVQSLVEVAGQASECPYTDPKMVNFSEIFDMHEKARLTPVCIAALCKIIERCPDIVNLAKSIEKIAKEGEKVLFLFSDGDMFRQVAYTKSQYSSEEAKT